MQYAYSEMASGANHSRLTAITYPDGTELDLNYDSGLDNSISRLSSMEGGSTIVEEYAYLGLDTVVKQNKGTQLNIDGVEASESTSLNRPIMYSELDNLGETTAVEQYDGDNVSITDANGDGVPDKPSSSLLG